MNVKASEAISEAWAALEGHAVGAFPLRRYLGGSAHSGVFLTEFAGREPSEVALKLVAAPATPALADSQLSRWLAASRLDHPHLLRLLGAGRCRVDGMHYLYAVMEYSDQNLAQLLERRALTQDEAREMLVPALQALAFLHERKFVQGRLRPSNVLVVGDRLKLASDAIRPGGEALDGVDAMSMHDSPEARDGIWSGAGDVWALGVTLCEALTCRQPSGLLEGRGSVVLPAELSPAFREVVGRCLSRRADERPSVVELEAWIGGQPLAPAPAVLQAQATIALLEPAMARASAAEAAPVLAVSPTATRPAATVASSSPTATQPPVQVAPVSSIATQSAQPLPSGSPIVVQPFAPVPTVSETAVSQRASAAQPTKRRMLPLILGAVIVIVLGWVGVRVLKTDDASAPSAIGVPTPPAAESASDAGIQVPGASEIPATQPTPSDAAPVVSSVPPPPPAGADAAESPSVVHQEIPDVPQRARQTIRGHVKVSVRVMVNQDGTVFAALTDRPGPSRYFERLALEAAKKWTFSPVGTEDQRIVLLRFDFAREGATARAVTVR